MEINIDKLTLFLNQLLPINGITDYCPNGLQVEGKTAIKKIGTAVSASVATIEAALEENVDALIVHHGIFWQRESAVIQGTKRKKLSLLLTHGLSLYAYHLPLDIHPIVGNNWKAARDLGWKNLSPFGYVNGIPIGVKGEVDQCSREEFLTKVESYYRHPATCAWGGSGQIQQVALVSGGGYRCIEEAAENNIDAFITGSFDEPAWHLAFEERVDFLALGHAATERVGPIALADYIEKQLSIQSCFIDIENPF